MVGPGDHGSERILWLVTDQQPSYQIGTPVCTPVTTCGGNITRNSLREIGIFENDDAEGGKALEVIRHELLFCIDQEGWPY